MCCHSEQNTATPHGTTHDAGKGTSPPPEPAKRDRVLGRIRIVGDLLNPDMDRHIQHENGRVYVACFRQDRCWAPLDCVANGGTHLLCSADADALVGGVAARFGYDLCPPATSPDEPWPERSSDEDRLGTECARRAQGEDYINPVDGRINVVPDKPTPTPPANHVRVGELIAVVEPLSEGCVQDSVIRCGARYLWEFGRDDEPAWTVDRKRSHIFRRRFIAQAVADALNARTAPKPLDHPLLTACRWVLDDAACVDTSVTLDPDIVDGWVGHLLKAVGDALRARGDVPDKHERAIIDVLTQTRRVCDEALGEFGYDSLRFADVRHGAMAALGLYKVLENPPAWDHWYHDDKMGKTPAEAPSAVKVTKDYGTGPTLAERSAAADKAADDKVTARMAADMGVTNEIAAQVAEAFKPFVDLKDEFLKHRSAVLPKLDSLDGQIYQTNRRIDRLKVVDPGHN